MTTSTAVPPDETIRDDPSAGHPRRWLILGVMVVSLLVVSLDTTILNVALKTIQQDLRASQADMQWAINSYTLVFAGLTFTFGLLADRFGRKPILFGGLLLFGVGSAMSAWAGSPPQLIATRAIMGIGAATIFPTTLSIITNVFPAQQRARAIGLWSAAGGLGIAIGPLTGGYLLENWWWGSIFLVNVPFVIAGVTAIALLVPDSRDPNPGRIDPGGVLLSMAGIVALVYGIIRAGDKADWVRADVLGPIIAGVVLIAVFVLVERHTDHPALDVSLFRKPAFSAAVVSVTLVFFGLNGLFFVFSYYAQAVRGASPLRTGVLILPAAFGIVFGSAVAPRVVRAIGPKVVIATGMLLTAIGFAAYAWVGKSTATVLYELPVLATGLGIGLVLAPSTEAVMSAVPRATAGAASAVNSTVRLIGTALGVAVLGSLLASSYRDRIGTAVDVLPGQDRSTAAGSIGGTLETVSRIAAQARQAAGQGKLDLATAGRLRVDLTHLVDRANDAFVSAMHVTVVWGAVISLLGALVALIWMPGRPAEAAVAPEPAVTEAVDQG